MRSHVARRDSAFGAAVLLLAQTLCAFGHSPGIQAMVYFFPIAPVAMKGGIMTNMSRARWISGLVALVAVAAVVPQATAQTYGIDFRNTLMPASGGMPGTSGCGCLTSTSRA